MMTLAAAMMFGSASFISGPPCATLPLDTHSATNEPLVYDAETTRVGVPEVLRPKDDEHLLEYVIERRQIAGAESGEVVPDLTVVRYVDRKEAAFPFRFTRPSNGSKIVRYRISAVSAIECTPVEFRVRGTRERTPVLFATAVTGLVGITPQFGGAVWIKRFGVAASVMPLVPGEGSLKVDAEMAYRGNRGIFGVGARRRNVDDTYDAIAYAHAALELPGLKITPAGHASPWFGFEIHAASRKAAESWRPDIGFAVRIQLRWPPERWLQ